MSLKFPQVFLHSSVGTESAHNAGDLGLIPGWGRCPGEGNGNPLQYSCLENPKDMLERLSGFHFHFLHTFLLLVILPVKLLVYLLSRSPSPQFSEAAILYCYIENTSWQEANEIVRLNRDHKRIHFSKRL